MGYGFKLEKMKLKLSQQLFFVCYWSTLFSFFGFMAFREMWIFWLAVASIIGMFDSAIASAERKKKK